MLGDEIFSIAPEKGNRSSLVQVKAVHSSFLQKKKSWFVSNNACILCITRFLKQFRIKLKPVWYWNKDRGRESLSWTQATFYEQFKSQGLRPVGDLQAEQLVEAGSEVRVEGEGARAADNLTVAQHSHHYLAALLGSSALQLPKHTFNITHTHPKFKS